MRRMTAPYRPSVLAQLLTALSALAIVGMLAMLEGCATPNVLVVDGSELPDTVVLQLEGWHGNCGVAPEQWQGDFCRWYWYVYEPKLDAIYRAQGASGD